MGVEKIKAAFENGKKAFIPYVMGGDGGLEKLKERIRFLDEAGASIVEIGIPFSDPVADGPTIQRAGKRALDSGVTLKAFSSVSRGKERSTNAFCSYDIFKSGTCIRKREIH